MELHLYDFDGTLFRSPNRPNWWGPKTWAGSAMSLDFPCVPEKPGAEWWIGDVVASAKRSIANRDVWTVLCTGRSLQSSARYRVPELLRDAGLHFDEVLLNPGRSETASFKAVEVRRILLRIPEIEAVHVWEDQSLNLMVIGGVVEKLGRAYFPHKVRIPGLDPICKEEDVTKMESEGWSRMAGMQGPALWAADLDLGLHNAHREAERLVKVRAVAAQARQVLHLIEQAERLQQEIAEGVRPSFWQSLTMASAARVAHRYLTAGPRKAVFTEVIVDDPGDILRWWTHETGLPLLDKKIAHHMTVAFKPSPGEVLALPLGDKVRLQIVGWGADEHAQAVVVRPAGVHAANRIPHITVSTDAGTSPVYSNDLLERGWTPVHGPTIVGTVGFFDGKDHRWTLDGTIYEREELRPAI